MAVLRVPEENRTISGRQAVADYLGAIGVEYEVWEPSHPLDAGASQEAVLQAYTAEIERLNKRGGYVTADVVSLNPQTPGLGEMLAKFNREHWHHDDEVRFIVEGRGIFHVHPKDSPVVAIEVEAGDLIRVPRSVLHWFDLCADRQIRAIRLFQDPAGWIPHYSDSGIDQKFQPARLGSGLGE